MGLYYILNVAKEAIIPDCSVSQEAQRVDKKCQEAQRRNKDQIRKICCEIEEKRGRIIYLIYLFISF